MQPLHSESEGAIPVEQRRFKRLVIACQDLEDARQAVNRLLGLNGKSPPDTADSDIRHAMLGSAVVAYGRLLRPTRSSTSVPGCLPAHVVAGFTADQLTLHQRLLQLRDQEFAHSDAAVADVKVAVHDALGLLMPQSRVLRKYGLSNADLATLDGILSRIHAYLYDEMTRLYPILAPHGDF